jgi:hypothetical protein
MSYIINKTDGSVLTEVTDSNIDQIATDLTLIGKSASAYGEYLNENLVRLLENFANTSRPLNPLEGQLWYDTLERRIKVYDGSGFKLTSGTIVSDVIPSSIAQGDIWIDSKRHQLYFNDGVATILAGPYDPTITGFNIVVVLDEYGIGYTILVLTIAGTIFGIFSNDEFTLDPNSDIFGFSGVVKQGMNLVNLSAITNIADITNMQDATTLHNAVNLNTLLNTIKTAPALTLTIDITGYTGDKNARIITDYLNNVFPPVEYAVANVTGPKCKVICTDTAAVEADRITIRQFVIQNSVWTWQFNL